MTPTDAPLITLDEVASYVGRTPAAVRQTMKRAAKQMPDELGEILLGLKVRVGARRIMFSRAGLVQWLQMKAADVL